MPKEQGHLGERVPRGTSKNAKDKSNCATLLASQSSMHRDQRGMGLNRSISRCDSEKDSGYSEAGSDSLQTDLDDQRSVSERPQGHRGSLSAYEKITPIYVIKNLVVKSSGSEQLLQSPWGGGWHSLSSAKATPPQLLLIQQPGIPGHAHAPSSNLSEPQGQSKTRGGRSNKNHNSGVDSYLPILNSYPRIAPHPKKEGSEQARAKDSGSEGHSQSKRVRTEEKREAMSTTSQLHQPQQRHAQLLYSPQPPHTPPSSSSNQHRSYHRAKPSPSTSRSNSAGSPSVSSSQAPSPPFSTGSSSSAGSLCHPTPEVWGGNSLLDNQLVCSPIRQRHFLNTTEILSQSGLLAVTLRTKELLRQNAATEREIAQLRQHAQLLCLAAQASAQAQTSQQGPSESSKPLDRLLQTMAQSGSYPSLDCGQVKALDYNHHHHLAEKGDETEQEKDGHREGGNRKDHRLPPNPVLASMGNHGDGASPPSPLFAPSPAPEGGYLGDALFISPPPDWSLPVQGQRRRGGAKPICDLIMPPDSSTHKQYLL